MSREYVIERYYPVSLSQKDIAALGAENVAFLSTILFAANEIYVFQKFLVSSIRPSQRDSEMDYLKFIQQGALLRVLSGKLFEFVKVFEDQRKIWARRSHSEETQRTDALAEDLKSIKGSMFYNLTKNMRNGIISHYLVSAFKNIEHISPIADLSLQMHIEQGNSFFPIGEEIVLVGFLNRYLN